MTITVNGRRIVLTDQDSRVYSYEAICLLTGYPQGATVTYYKADKDPDRGSLVPGESVTVKDGTILNAANTSSA